MSVIGPNRAIGRIAILIGAAFAASVAHAAEPAASSPADGSAQPERVLVSDSLSTDDARKADQPLARTGPQVGEGKWLATAGVQFTDAKAVTSKEAVSGEAVIDFSAKAAKEVTVSATVVIKSTDWVGVALSEKAALAWFSPNTKASLILRPNGRWSVLGPGCKERFAGGQIEGFDPARAYRLQLRYHPASRKVSAWIDGASVAGDIDIGLKDDAVGAAGFRMNGPLEPGTPRVSDFKISLLEE